ncbi:hypothetical protein U2063_15395, partial [Listeria monocytogenes]
GLLLVALFAAWAMYRFRSEFSAAKAVVERGGPASPILADEQYSMAQRFSTLPRVLPFVVLLTGVMVALYGGYATPSETAGLGGLLAL